MPFIVCDCPCSYRRGNSCELEIVSSPELPGRCPLRQRQERSTPSHHHGQDLAAGRAAVAL
ncbi:MAG: hypothetical protein PWP65_1396 [Clostridia bacterium]|nr:hypothetical protein [Clostridia bacterium]